MPNRSPTPKRRRSKRPSCCTGGVADGLVQEIMKKNPMSRKGWQYEHKGNNKWFFDHNWGAI